MEFNLVRFLVGKPLVLPTGLGIRNSEEDRGTQGPQNVTMWAGLHWPTSCSPFLGPLPTPPNVSVWGMAAV